MKPDKIYLGLALLIGVITSSCSDIFREKTVRVVGEIYVNNSDIPAEPGNHLVYYNGSFNQQLINCPIISLSGNSELIFVRAIDSDNDPKLYIIHHQNGDSIRSVTQVLKDVYDERIKKAKLRYSFSF